MKNIGFQENDRILPGVHLSFDISLMLEINKFIIATAAAVVLSTAVLHAQQSLKYEKSNHLYEQAMDLYQKQKYGSAYRAFDKLTIELSDNQHETYVNAYYYKALCAMNLFNRDADYLLRQFVTDHPESPRVKNAYFQLGRYNYRKRKWSKSVKWFANCDVFDLSKEDYNEYHFKLGYALLQLKKPAEAAEHLRELIGVPSNYYAPANYYYGHIAYEEGNYETALLSFLRLKDDPKFSVVTPYYITQIYYFKGEYDSLISVATPLFNNEKTKRRPEIAHLIGDAWFTKKNYEKAAEYYSFFIDHAETKSRADYYRAARALQLSNNDEKALKLYDKAITLDDTLSQKAAYRMGESYLTTGEKKYSRNAFYKAYEIGIIENISENALFNYAKLSYELDYDPYNKAIDAFIEYLKKYPKALRKEEAYSYLVNIYLSSKNYKSALASLETTKHLDPRLRSAYQQLQYNAGLEAFQNGQYQIAINSLELSQKQPENRELLALSDFWIAESWYRNKRYLTAANKYNEFIFRPGAILLKEFQTAHYNIGYAYFRARDYLSAAKWFRKYLTYDELNPAFNHDALIRTGDCYFITKNYLLAEEYYQRAASMEGREQDYALYQLATTQGVLKKKDLKASNLEKLLRDYPNSTYAMGAEYELGQTYMNQGEDNKALKSFNKIIGIEESSEFRKNSLLNIGLIYYNRNENSKALASFEQVVQENPSFRDSREALNRIEDIYRESGDIEGYERYIKTLGFMNVSDAALDSLTYESAELHYMSENCDKSIVAFESYLKKFQTPIFASRAHFYLAECLYNKGDQKKALNNYEYILEKKAGDIAIVEASLRRAAELNYKLNNYALAKQQFEQIVKSAKNNEELEDALWFGLRSAYKVSDYQFIIANYRKYIEAEFGNEQRTIEVEFMAAKSAEKLNKKHRAIALYTSINGRTQSEKSAISLYRISSILYEDKRIDTAEVVIFQLVNHTPTYDKWLAKGLILLSDIYVLREDYFQARATLESIVKNYQGSDEILEEARNKLNMLNELETMSSAPILDSNQVDEIEFDSKYDELFEEEEPIEEEIPGMK
ncbi:MAG TPA: hypothetical protein DDX92_09410 [Flavobacteriales bacterium]|nr:hypothetical protein [Flavobacteriales bacterium]